MIPALIVLIIFILGLTLLIKLTHLKHKILLVIGIFLIIFFYLTFTAVIRNQSLDLSTQTGILEAGKVYFSWAGQSLSNLKTLTFNAVRMDWLPEGTNSTDLNPKRIMQG